MKRDDTITTGRQLQELSETESWQLVESGRVGRLAWTGPEGITVVPINYSLEVSPEGRRSVLIRTAAYSALARECDDSLVAFQVDRHDPIARAGWSVLVRGHAHIEFDAAPGEPAVDVWLSGMRPLHVRVQPSLVTGRRLRDET